MKMLKQLFNGKGYIDGITIINLEGEILFTAKLNGKLSNQENSKLLLGQKFLDVYENLTPSTSSTYKAMELGVPLYVENQLLKAKGREPIRITSLSIPIKSRDRIVGAIDLSMQEASEEAAYASSEAVGLSPVDFPVSAAQRLAGSKDTASFTMDDIIAVDEQMKQAKEYVPVVASCALPVLIYGETGTGKEVFAQAIHNASDRRDKPFIAQNCAAIPDTLLESILFGTAKGAFTGAVENKGLFELADGGTLFLDEINSMPLHLQSKLLQVLQDGSFRSLGARTAKRVDVKIVAATNVEPVQAVQQGQLRQDIYYRLSMMSIHIPPLRERKKDISSFVNLYVNKHNNTFHKQIQYVSKELLTRLEQYDWPGNVRELEQIIVYGVSRVEGNRNRLEFEDVSDRLCKRPDTDSGETAPCRPVPLPKSGLENQFEGAPLRTLVCEYERELIRQALNTTGGNYTKAAKLLAIPRQTLQRKVKQYGILPETEQRFR